jgi:hypothetical protein
MTEKAILKAKNIIPGCLLGGEVVGGGKARDSTNAESKSSKRTKRSHLEHEM